MRISAVAGFQSFTSVVLTTAVACSTALFKNVTTGVIANGLLFTVGGSSGGIRWRDDGVDPTSNIGIRLASGALPYLYTGDAQRIKFIADSAAGNASLDISYVNVQID